MPKAIDYVKTQIYKLVCKDEEVEDVYVGSTVDFGARRCRHRSDCHNDNSQSYNLYVYRFIRDHGGFCNWSMVLIEKYPCLSKKEAYKRERYNADLLGSTLNSLVASRTKEEYYQEKKEYILKRNKAYRLLKSFEPSKRRFLMTCKIA